MRARIGLLHAVHTVIVRCGEYEAGEGLLGLGRAVRSNGAHPGFVAN